MGDLGKKNIFYCRKRLKPKNKNYMRLAAA
jgi:hypothetical protein